MANTNVPNIKPNCTEPLMYPNDSVLILNAEIKSSIIELPANQSEVQQN
ncbi:hypothetical protein WPG_2469 [Winogradskyella sp. PG-2]|nr:hypothetical protein WPG_2469 [Winogradskyella sp. PG-2]